MSDPKPAKLRAWERAALRAGQEAYRRGFDDGSAAASKTLVRRIDALEAELDRLRNELGASRETD